MSAAALATTGRGFEQPAQAAQQTFRSVLEAMARPGRVQRIAASALAGIEAPGVGAGLCAVLLTLLDGECSLHVDDALPRDALLPYLRFHTGVRAGPARAACDFVIAPSQASAGLWTELRSGSDEAPQRGATLIVEVAALDAALASAVRLRLSGPGIETVQRLSVGGPGVEFWHARIAVESQFPHGIDLLLCCADRVAAVPRSTRVEVEG